MFGTRAFAAGCSLRRALVVLGNLRHGMTEVGGRGVASNSRRVHRSARLCLIGSTL